MLIERVDSYQSGLALDIVIVWWAIILLLWWQMPISRDFGVMTLKRYGRRLCMELTPFTPLSVRLDARDSSIIIVWDMYLMTLVSTRV